MAGRPKAMAVKAGELEGEVLSLYRRLEAAIPETHRGQRRDGSPVSNSPWAKLYRASCALVIAAGDVGDHCRNAAGMVEPGPIAAGLGEEALRMIRLQSVGNRSHNEAGIMERLDAMAQSGGIPGHAPIRDEIEWVARNLHVANPDIEEAPSIAAANMLIDVRADPTVRRDFWNLVWSRRLAPGEKKPRPNVFADEADESDADHARELERRLFGDLAS